MQRRGWRRRFRVAWRRWQDGCFSESFPVPDFPIQTYNRSTANRSVYRQELSPLLFIERAATAHRDRVAVRDGLAEYRYGEWRAHAGRLAAALRRAELQRGDRIVFVSPPSEPLLLAHLLYRWQAG